MQTVCVCVHTQRAERTPCRAHSAPSGGMGMAAPAAEAVLRVSGARTDGTKFSTKFE
eukprot:SAG31_NODE_1204_length_9412_cov_3.727585_5_plen_57_part_00